MKATSDRFWAKVNKRGPIAENMITPCWLWFGGKGGIYGRFWDGTYLLSGNQRQVLPHRWAYVQAYGKINLPTLDHLCRTPLCVRPSHLEAVTMRVNTLRGHGPTALNARKTTCLRGHHFIPQTTGQHKNGGRYCKLCQNSYQQRKKVVA